MVATYSRDDLRAGRAEWIANPSFNPRRATASSVRPACGTSCIITARPYAARLRARG